MIELEDIIEIYGKQYRCWVIDNQSGNDLELAQFEADRIYIHLINIDNDSDAICLVYNELITQLSYIDWLVQQQRLSNT